MRGVYILFLVRNGSKLDTRLLIDAKESEVEKNKFFDSVPHR
jgi:hypothetical protein